MSLQPDIGQKSCEDNQTIKISAGFIGTYTQHSVNMPFGEKTLGAEVVLSQQGVYVLLPDKPMRFIPCEPPSGCIDFA